MAVRGLLIDKMGRGTIVCLSILYFVVLAVLVLAAALSPDRFDASSREISYACPAGPTQAETCQVELPPGIIEGMTPLNQFAVVRASFQRPQLTSSSGGLSTPALLPLEVSANVMFTMDVQSGSVFLGNLTHVARAVCPANVATCNMGSLAFLPSVPSGTLSVQLTLVAPHARFAALLGPAAEASMDPVVDAELRVVYVRSSYTSAWRHGGAWAWVGGRVESQA